MAEATSKEAAEVEVSKGENTLLLVGIQRGTKMQKRSTQTVLEIRMQLITTEVLVWIKSLEIPSLTQ